MDAPLWRAWRERKDGRAFEALVRPHLPFATAFARRLGCGPDDADEVVQRSLVRLASEPRDKPARVGVRAWLGRDVLQETRMLVRSRSRRERHEAEVLPSPGPGTAAVDARDEVEAALAGLDEDSRRAVELRFLHDLEYREVAFVMGRSPLACRLLVHRAIGRLRKRFGRAALLLVAALPRAGEMAAARAAEAVAVATSSASAGGIAATVAGGVAMATAWKVGGAAAGIVLLGWLGWSVARPSSESKDGLPVAAVAPPPVPGLAAAPPKPVDPGSNASMAAGAPPAAAPAPDDAPARVPLDAPIPPGKGSVAGTIRFTDGTPFAARRVGLWMPGVVSETDADGRFHIHGERVGEREFTVTGPNEYFLGLGPVTLRAGERVNADLTIDRGYALEARVVDAVTGAPVAGGKVTLRRPGAHTQNVMQAGFGFVKTAVDGRFRFDLLPAASYYLSVEAAGYRTYVWTGESGAVEVPLDIRLTVAMPLVLRYVGAPPAAVGTKVQWMIQKSGDPFGQDGRGTLPENGEIRGDAPPPGDYHLIVFDSGSLPRFEEDLSVKEGEAVTVLLRVPGSGSVAGTLRDAAGRPVPGVRLRIADAPAVATDADGRFAVPRAPLGTHTVWIDFDDGTVRVGAVDVSAERATDVDLRLSAVGEVSARVPGAAIVAVFLPGGNNLDRKVADARPDANGGIRIRFLPPGSYRLLALGGDKAEDEERAIDLLPGQSLDLGEIRLRRYPVVPVAVTFPPDAKRPSMLFATVVREIGGTTPPPPYFRSGRVEFDGEGRGWLKGLPAGEFVLRFASADSAPAGLPRPGSAAISAEATVVIRDGITTPIAIDLRLP